MSARSRSERGSLADVSRRAGVSTATASRVLNGSPHPVSAATRERVMQAAQDLSYSPSALARALVTRRTRIIGVIVGDVVDPYFAEITRGVEDCAGRAGYLTIVCNADRRPEVEREYLNLLRDYNAEGAVFAGSGLVVDDEELSATVEQARRQGMHVVALAPRAFEGSSVTVDNRAAARDLTEYLVSLGHRTIAFVAGPAGLLSARERLAGFDEALAGHSLEPGSLCEGDFSYASGHAAALELLARNRLPDAVIGANDETAIGVLTGLRGAGVDVPGTLSVAGIGDTRPASFLELTTVSIPTFELGASAARRIIAGRESDDESHVVIPHRLVPRATSARRASAG
jgi:LacI family transcriptional regulator